MKAAVGKGRVWGWGRLADTPHCLSAQAREPAAQGTACPHLRAVPTGARLAEVGVSRPPPGSHLLRAPGLQGIHRDLKC